jgi:hypothetical protein
MLNSLYICGEIAGIDPPVTKRCQASFSPFFCLTILNSLTMENYFNIYVDPNFKNPNYRFPNEEFKPILGYEGLYSISNVGRVRSERRLKWNGQGYVQLKEKIISHFVGKGKLAYYGVHLWENNQAEKCFIHRLVGIVFCGGIQNETVNHKDGIKTHNFASNLEWVSYGDNNRHAFRNGLMNPVKGMEVHCAKLTDSNVREIRELIAIGMSQRKIAAKFGITRSSIQKISSGEGWKHVR